MVVITRGYGSGSGSGSDVGTEIINERIHEFLMSEITRGILDSTPMMFGMMNEGIMEILDKHLGAFRTKIATSQFGHPFSLIRVSCLWGF